MTLFIGREFTVITFPHKKTCARDTMRRKTEEQV